jgi:predicted regulator of Ras-like GTPase activity (Roadblock/LC7/MglB family)
MSESIRAMTAELVADPASLVFLDLGETLRRRGQFQAALRVAESGIARYPELADARDLAARIHSDLGDGEAAFDAWMDALQRDPSHLGAHKGLGFLYYRAGDLPRALRHLEMARARSDEPGLARAIATVRATLDGPEGAEVPQAPASAQRSEPRAPMPRRRDGLPFELEEEENDDLPPEAELFEGFEGARDGLLLLDVNGLRLGGGLRNRDGRDVADAVAAHLSGVSREAARAARLLDLGTWQRLSAECGPGNLHLAAPSPDTVLLAARDASVTAGRLAVIADRAAAAARRWLERVS